MTDRIALAIEALEEIIRIAEDNRYSALAIRIAVRNRIHYFRTALSGERDKEKCTCGQSGHGNAHEPGCPQNDYRPVQRPSAAEIRNEALEEAARWHDIKHEYNDLIGHVQSHKDRATFHKEAAKAIRALKSNSNEAGQGHAIPAAQCIPASSPEGEPSGVSSDGGALEPSPLAASCKASASASGRGVEAAAKLLAEWFGYPWDGIIENGRLDDRFPHWISSGIGRRGFQGYKQDVRDVVERIAALVKPAAFDMLEYLRRQRVFSERAFGPIEHDRRQGVVDHIRKELIEVEADIGDLKEWIDVVTLALDGAWRSGHSPEEICAQLDATLQRNEKRQWPDWRSMPADKAIEHVRAPEGK